MKIHLTIDMGGLIKEMKLDKDGNPIEDDGIEIEEPEELSLEGLLAGCISPYKIEVI